MGLNYNGSDGQLNGCINDVERLKDFLINTVGYTDDQIQTMTDDSDDNHIPTKANILTALDQFVDYIQDNQVKIAFLSYSGHGTYIRDRSGDESDQKDEALVPLDYQTSGIITDDVVQQYLKRIPNSCRVFSIFDCCHSGTMCDLNFSYHYVPARKGIKPRIVTRRVKTRYKQRYRKRNRVRVPRKSGKGYRWKTRYTWAHRWKTKYRRKKVTVWKQKPRPENWKKIREKRWINLDCRLCSLTGCRDSQTSADAYYAHRGEWAGALTHAFLDIVQSRDISSLSCKTLLLELNKSMRHQKFTQSPTLHLNSMLSENQSLQYFLK